MSDGGDGGGGGDVSRSRKKKKARGVITKDRTEALAQQLKKEETMWRVVLHNDEVHTFKYVIQTLIKVIGTLDRKTSYEICAIVHTKGMGTVTTTWKEQAEKFCMRLQRQGLTVSIAPDSKFLGPGGNGDEDDRKN